MQGLVNLVNDLALAMAWLLPMACYIAAWIAFLTGAWGLWQQRQPQNPFVGRPWVPWIGIVLSGVFATFDRILTKSTTSAGLDTQVSLGASVTGYTDAATGSVISGTGPEDAILSIVSDFALFFEMFGAWAAFMAVVAWNASATGKTNRSKLSCLIQFVFGVILLNPVKEATWILNHWTTSG